MSVGTPGDRFLTDFNPPGLLHAVVLCSPHPHALIEALDVAPARALNGVVAVVTAQDIPGRGAFGVRIADQPYLCRDKVRMSGDPVAAVAAETPEIARRALASIAVRYKLLPVVTDAAFALSDGAPHLHEGGNLLHETHYARGDLGSAFARAAHIVEDVYRTPRQVPHFIEPEGAVAVPSAEGLTIHAPGHWAEMERREIAAMLALDAERVRVIASPVGGSFGGKDCLHAQPIAALLAYVSRRPVRLIWPREHSFAAGVKRHPFIIRMRSGVTADGRLCAHQVELLADTGAYAQHGPEVLETAHGNAQGSYAWGAVSITGRLAYTNNGISGAVRGFGAVQVQTALEQQISRLALLSGHDPIEFRRMNLRDERDPGQLGQTLAAPAWASRAVAALPPLPAPRREGRWLVGTGVALIEKNEGFAAGGPLAGDGAFSLAPGGRIEVRTGLSELGQGLSAAAVAAATRLVGCAEEDVDVVAGDSGGAPDTGPVAASRGAGVLWRALHAAAPAFRAAILARAAEVTGIAMTDLDIGSGGVRHRSLRANAPLADWLSLATSPIVVTGHAPAILPPDGEGACHALFSACAAMAEVAVDTATGRVVVRRLFMAPVTGPVLSLPVVEGQMAGGASMAAGFVTLESLPTSHGRFRASNLDGYFAPTIMDAFPVTTRCIDDIPDDVAGPRGVGEIGMNAAAPAIANAVLVATGFVCRDLPVDPAAMLAHLDAGR